MTSTPCHIVFNSSAKFQGLTLSNYWAKSPDLLNNMLGILLRFQERSVALTCNIKKMYHSVKTYELDQHKKHHYPW